MKIPDAQVTPSNYIIEDILQTVRNGNADEIKKVCSKYCERYHDDDDFIGILKIVLSSIDEKGCDIPEIDEFLKKFLQIRRTAFSGSGLWFSLHPETEIAEPESGNTFDSSGDVLISPIKDICGSRSDKKTLKALRRAKC